MPQIQNYLYYTQSFWFRISTDAPPIKHRCIIAKLRKYSEIARNVFNTDGHTVRFTNTRRLEGALISFSQYYPEVLFVLERFGWAGEANRLYIKNTKSQDCPGQIFWADFDENKML